MITFIMFILRNIWNIWIFQNETLLDWKKKKKYVHVFETESRTEVDDPPSCFLLVPLTCLVVKPQVDLKVFVSDLDLDNNTCYYSDDPMKQNHTLTAQSDPVNQINQNHMNGWAEKST